MQKRAKRFPELEETVMGLFTTATEEPNDDLTGGGQQPSDDLEDPIEAGEPETLETIRKALAAQRQRADKERKARRALELKMDSVKDLDPETYRKAQERAAEAERIAAEAQAREAEKLRETEQKYSNKLQEALAERERAIRDLEMTRQRYALEKVFLANDGLSVVGEDGVSAFDMFWDRLSGRFKIDPTDGTLGVVDSNGDWELDGESGKRLKPSDFIAKQRDHQLYSFLFKPKYGSGSGMAPGRDVRTAHGQDLNKLSTQEKFALAYGSKQR